MIMHVTDFVIPDKEHWLEYVTDPAIGIGSTLCHWPLNQLYKNRQDNNHKDCLKFLIRIPAI